MIKPMKYQDLQALVDWQGPDPFGRIEPYFRGAVIEPKYDGCSVFVTFGEDANVITSATLGLNRSDNFPHLRDALLPGATGSIVQAELVAPADPLSGRQHGLLTQSTGLMNSNPGPARYKQQVHGPAMLFVFDVIEVLEHPVMDRSYAQRRELLEEIMEKWRAEHPELPVEIVPQLPARADTLAALIADGYEGGMIKRLGSTYQPGTRHGGWKIKTRSTADVFITGYRPGKDSNEGLVGSFEVSIMIDGKPANVGHCGNFTRELRRQISAPDGSLVESCYGKVIEVTAQGVGVNGKFRHCLYQGFRDDKNPEHCDEAQLEGWPRV